MNRKTKLFRTLAAALFLGIVLTAAAPSVYAKSKLEKSVETIVNGTVEKKDAPKVKLKKLFTYVTYKKTGKSGKVTKENYGYAGARPTVVRGKVVRGWEQKGWPAVFAQEMITNRKGSCYHFAALYGMLAKKATGYPVRVAVGKTTGFGAIRDHAWTEVKIGKTWYVCDTNLDKYSGVDSLTYFLKKRSSLKKIYNKYKSVKTYTIKF